MPFKGGRYRVFLVKPPRDWRPQRLWDAPPTFEAGELRVKKATSGMALGFARAFNKEAVERGGPVEQWAIVARHLRPEYRAKGGAR